MKFIRIQMNIFNVENIESIHISDINHYGIIVRTKNFERETRIIYKKINDRDEDFERIYKELLSIKNI